MRRKVLCMLTVVMLWLGLIPVAFAAENTGKIQILPNYQGVVVPGGEITLYRVGTAVPEGYRMTDGFGSWTMDAANALDPDMAQWLMQHILLDGVSNLAGEQGTVFTGLPEGLYLAVQTEPAPGYASFSPFFMELPTQEGLWKAEAYPKLELSAQVIPGTGDSMPLVAAILCMIFSVLGLAWMYRRT